MTDVKSKILRALNKKFNASVKIFSGKKNMLTTIAFVLIVLWLVGFIAFPVIGGFIHILLVIAVITILIRVIRGK